MARTGIALLILLAVAWEENRALATNPTRQYSQSGEEAAVLQLIERILPGRQKEFSVIIDKNGFNTNGLDNFEFHTVNSSMLQITATSGVAGAWAFNHFLKYFCKAHISWSGSQLLIPKPLPKVVQPVKISSPNRLDTFVV